MESLFKLKLSVDCQYKHYALPHLQFLLLHKKIDTFQTLLWKESEIVLVHII